MSRSPSHPPRAHIAAIGTAVPANEIHTAFVQWAEARIEEPRQRALFRRMAARSGIEHRWSVLPPPATGRSAVDAGGFYAAGSLPSTAARMALYAEEAPRLALAAVVDLARQVPIDAITHLVVASCTGFIAPGIDQLIAAELGLSPSVERTLVGFMGCYAAVAALRVAHHIVRSEPAARILVITVELSTLHLQADRAVEPLLAMLQFGDGAAAALVTAEPHGLALERFFATTLPGSGDLIRWWIGDEGFVMHLSGEVPGRIAAALHDPGLRDAILGEGEKIDTWAVHAGGRSILDAVEHGFDLPPNALQSSRDILARYGNMSSATLMFVLRDKLADTASSGRALAFGPGLAAEGFSFRRAS